MQDDQNAKKTKVLTASAEDKTNATAEGTVPEADWNALYGVRKSVEMGEDLKRGLFVATVESVLQYGAETWTLTAQKKKGPRT